MFISLTSIIILMDQIIFQSISDFFWNFLQNLNSWFSDHGYTIILIIFIAWLAKKFSTQLIMRFLEKTVRQDLYPTKSDRQKRLKTLSSLIGAIVHVAAVIIAGVMIISELGVNTTPIVASAGVIGVALGFGAQSLIKDLTSGLFIIIENQYRVGDVINLDNGVNGKVEAITIRTTQVRALDGTLYHVPNGTIQWTANKTSSYAGIDENIVFPLNVDIDKLAMVINRTGEKIAEMPEFAKKIKTPPHFSQVIGFDPSGIKVKVVAKTGSEDAWEVKGEFYNQLLKELKRSKIDIPYTHLTFANPNLKTTDTKKPSKTS